jgi:hypothetical protein
MARKVARPRFKYAREFINKDGKPDTYIERRGLQEFKTSVLIQASSKSLPRSQEVARHLAIAASEILKKVGEKTLSDVLEGVKQAKPKDEDAIKAAVMAWDFDIAMRYGIFSPVTLAANFLSGVHSITNAFVDSLTDKQADDAVPHLTRRVQQVFELPTFGIGFIWRFTESTGSRWMAHGPPQISEPQRQREQKERKNAWRWSVKRARPTGPDMGAGTLRTLLSGCIPR